MQPLPRRTYLTSLNLDFWLLGGASIAVWILLMIGDIFKSTSPAVGQRYFQLAATFSMLSLVCNHPHFLVSYRFAYGRGLKFVTQHWFRLLFAPLLLIGFFAIAFLEFDYQITKQGWFDVPNGWLEQSGLEFRLGYNDELGLEILSLSVWLMNLTVGWHYAKQVFGCILTQAKYHAYKIELWQRRLLKVNLYALSLANFLFFASRLMVPVNGEVRYFSVPLSTIGISERWMWVSTGLAVTLSIAVAIGVIGRGYLRTKQLPHANVLVAWMAFHFWWLPSLHHPEFYLLMVPFFHSLQYLPFAYRVEAKRSQEWGHLKIAGFVTLLLAAGFISFEGLPSLLDSSFRTDLNMTPMFFLIAIPVFINIHHFMIDSVVWRLDHAEVREALFDT